MLENVKVLSFTHFLQGPLAAQMLGDFGADVIKIERMTGAFERHWSGHNMYLNGMSVNFLLSNRNERSLSIDLKARAGKEVIYDLVRGADVLIENFRPGVMDRLGFGYETLKRINPALIYCSCSGYGESGPCEDAPGQDLLAQARSGLMTQSGRKSDSPIALGAPVVDTHAAVLAASAIIAALYAKMETGEGRRIESNLLDAALDLQIEPFNIHLNGYSLYDRSESGISSRFGQAPYGVFKTADNYICVSMTPLEKLAFVFEDQMFLMWVEDGQFAKREEINKLVAQHMPQHDNEYWVKKFEESGLWYSLIYAYDDMEKHPQVQWNKMFIDIEHPVAGKVRLVSNPVRFDGEAPKITRMPPMLGEHTREILHELCYSEEKIQSLLDTGVAKQY